MTTLVRESQTDDPFSFHDRGPSPAHATALLTAAAVAGLWAGAATSYAQGVLPAEWSQLANSGAVWTVVAAAVALACARVRWLAVLAGTVALVAEVAGYYAVASALRGVPTTRAEWLLWSIAALWVGPAAGLAAWGIARGRPRQRVCAVLALAGLVAGEGLYEVRHIGAVRFGWAELWLAGLTALAAGVFTSAAWGRRAGAVGLGVAVAVSTYAVYAQTTLL